ncbi:MAG: tocopherol cyclase family protein [Bacillota bacterium]|nr:tocopherol cyclase family protein [Bacillota bacterium]
MNLKSFRYPDLYHGRMGKSYFEGWYFKLVDKKMERVFTFITGIFFGSHDRDSHAFIQIVDGVKRTYHYVRFPTSNFTAERDIFDITVGSSRFGTAGISLTLDRPNIILSGQLGFDNHLNWPDSIINPGSMGFYNYIPRMQCYSQVCSMDFDLRGILVINGEKINFDGGRGYIEKKWGSSFPFSWVWIQCNHFGKERASLSCSVGHIPFLFTSFRGFLVGLFVNQTFFEFTTMNKSSVDIIPKGTDITLNLHNARHSLTIDTETSPGHFIFLNGPRDDRMVPLVQENLQGTVHVELKERTGNKIIYSDTSLCAGIEYGGKQMLLVESTEKYKFEPVVPEPNSI